MRGNTCPGENTGPAPKLLPHEVSFSKSCHLFEPQVPRLIGNCPLHHHGQSPASALPIWLLRTSLGCIMGGTPTWAALDFHRFTPVHRDGDQKPTNSSCPDTDAMKRPHTSANGPGFPSTHQVHDVVFACGLLCLLHLFEQKMVIHIHYSMTFSLTIYNLHVIETNVKTKQSYPIRLNCTIFWSG